MATDYSGHINQAYRQYLGRDAEEGGLKNWQGHASKKGIGSAIKGIKGSAEAGMRDDRLSSVAGQMDEITGKDSPLMQRAATQGKQFSNQRGLLNSSMAAGASQGAMMDRAMPIAQQDAGYRQDLGRMEQQDQYAQGQMRLGSNLNRQEAQQLHRQDLERLGAGSSANAWGVMANNVTDIVAQGMEGIANIQANPDIKPADKTQMISQITKMRDADINFQKRLLENMSGLMRNSGLFPNL